LPVFLDVFRNLPPPVAQLEEESGLVRLERSVLPTFEKGGRVEEDEIQVRVDDEDIVREPLREAEYSGEDGVRSSL
jgi:hypothetical protein